MRCRAPLRDASPNRGELSRSWRRPRYSRTPFSLMVRACESLEGGASDEQRLTDDANYGITSSCQHERLIGLARPALDGDGGEHAALFALRRRSCRDAEQSMPSQDVVGETEPVQHGGGLLFSANGELLQPPLAEAGVDAFGH